MLLSHSELLSCTPSLQGVCVVECSSLRAGHSVALMSLISPPPALILS